MRGGLIWACRNRFWTRDRTDARVQTSQRDEGVYVFALLAFALSTAAVIIGFTSGEGLRRAPPSLRRCCTKSVGARSSRDWRGARCGPDRVVASARRRGNAIAFGLSVALGVAAGNKEIRRSLPRLTRRFR